MNKILFITVISIVLFSSCKKEKQVPVPAPVAKEFALTTDTLWQYEFFSPMVKDTASTGLNKESYTWNWGDNTSSTGLNSNHQYLNGGKYTIKLTTNGGTTSKDVFVHKGTGSFQIVNSFTEPLTEVVLTSNSKQSSYLIGTLNPNAKSDTISISLPTEYGPSVVTGYVGDASGKRVFFEWKENYLPTHAHQVYSVTGRTTVYFYNSYGYLQDTYISEWLNFAF